MVKRIVIACLLLSTCFVLSGCAAAPLVGGLLEVTLDSASENAKQNRIERINKENNTGFNHGVDTEQFVRSILDANGKPDDELLFQDVTPAKKILVYKREFTSGKGYRVFLFTFDQGKNQFIFWDNANPYENEYLSFKQDKGSNKYFKAGWYVETLLKQIHENEEKGRHNIASEYVNKLLEQKSEFEGINAEAYNSTAWFLATCKDLRYRDAEKALEYAQKAVAINRSASYLDTLAAAYAENGNFEKAVELETETYNMALDKNSGISLEHLNSFKELIEVYRSRRTYAQWKYGEKLTSK